MEWARKLQTEYEKLSTEAEATYLELMDLKGKVYMDKIYLKELANCLHELETRWRRSKEASGEKHREMSLLMHKLVGFRMMYHTYKNDMTGWKGRSNWMKQECRNLEQEYERLTGKSLDLWRELQIGESPGGLSEGKGSQAS
jgi:predicted  nucleic acid-binding Zn-ribbon protein